METVHFVGWVIPPESNVTISHPPTVTIEEKDLNFKAEFVVYVQNSRVDVHCNIDRYNSEDQFTQILLYIRAFDLARASVDLVSFATGAGYRVFLGAFVDPKGIATQLNFIDPALGALCTAYKVNTSSDDTSFGEIYKIVISDFQLFMALNDLILANALPHIGPINCGRVIDALRRLCAPGISNVGAAWDLMQTKLNVSRDYREFVTKTSANPRHADRSYIPTSVTSELMHRTWTMFNRFLEYRKRGNIPLTSQEFPLL